MPSTVLSAGILQSSNPAKFVFRASMQLVSYYSNFQNTCPTIYSLPVISRTQTLVDWRDFLSLSTPMAAYSSAQDWGPDYPQGNVSILLFGFFWKGSWY